jgi:transcription elongation GreA/GreB family factor
MNKAVLKQKILDTLEAELKEALLAADNAHQAAIDEQSKAETQYDTLSIEASYLAEGQSKRILQLKEFIQAYQRLALTDYHQEQAIGLGALIQLDTDIDADHWFFLGPCAGGMKVNEQGCNVTVITLQSPMGQALYQRYCGDDVYLGNSRQALSFIAKIN